jgi:hypothetical protein
VWWIMALCPLGCMSPCTPFRVLGREGEVESKDHAALSVCIDLQHALQVAAPGGPVAPKRLGPQGIGGVIM